ncbi:riboflavin-binding protein-like [Patiria miniata]|uniref:Folate receptor-like domain-containing protein n=1 Tax=Patiria miniata TaxID=46514 RepID=A0A914BJ06_PATMI|nr:riboflavin-binding protein-like [Patiria miniata]
MAVICRWFSILRVFLIVFLSYVVGQVCTYYGNYRYAEQQSNLSNCTWYRNMACCRRTEVSSVFGSMFKIHGETRQCKSRLNYMMCYFCSPSQVDWYDSKVVICSDFCEETFEMCKEARLGDSSIGEKYESGRQFCEANNFEVVPGRERCFSFDPTAFDSAITVQPGIVGLLACLSTALLRF